MIILPSCRNSTKNIQSNFRPLISLQSHTCTFAFSLKIYSHSYPFLLQHPYSSMEIPTTFQAHPWQVLFPSPLHLPHQYIPENYVHWTQAPEFHVYSADLPGVRKEEIKVEVEDSRYLIIRTEATDESREPPRSFMRKFRLPGQIHVDEISAGYEDGVLTVKVPRAHVRRGFFIDPVDVLESLEAGARAA